MSIMCHETCIRPMTMAFHGYRTNIGHTKHYNIDSARNLTGLGRSFPWSWSTKRDMSWPSKTTKVCRPKTNVVLKPTLCTICIHSEAPNVCMSYIVLVLGRHTLYMLREEGGTLMILDNDRGEPTVS